MFDATAIDKLIQLCNSKLNVGIQQDRKELAAAIAKDDQEELTYFDEQLAASPPSFTRNNMDNFYVSDKEIIFIYPFEFPHAILALEPGSEFSCSKEELKPFIKKDGTLSRWIQ